VQLAWVLARWKAVGDKIVLHEIGLMPVKPVSISLEVPLYVCLGEASRLLGARSPGTLRVGELVGVYVCVCVCVHV